MKSIPQCLTCFIDDILGAVDMLGVSPAMTTEILSASLAYLADHVGDDVPPSYHITALHRILKKKLGLAMPFEQARQSSFVAGTQIAAIVEKDATAKSSIDKFKLLCRWSVAANSLDFRTAGAGYDLSTDAVEKLLRSYATAGLTVDELDAIFAVVKQANRIVYVPDNVGELPFDKLLISQLTSFGAHVTVPLRGGPITSDAVMDDAIAAGIPDVAASVILAGPDTLGISFTEMSDELALALSQADLIIAKGQANYYVLSAYGKQFTKAHIVCLFTAKCSHVWQQFGCTKKASVAAIIQKPVQ